MGMTPNRNERLMQQRLRARMEEQEAALREQEAAAQERIEANESLRQARRAALEAERQGVRDRQAAMVDAEIAPLMASAERQWLIDHPGQDFATVRDLVRQQIIDEGQQVAHEHEMGRLRATGRYS